MSSKKIADSPNGSETAQIPAEIRAEMLYYTYLLNIGRFWKRHRADRMTEDKRNELEKFSPRTRMDAWLQTVRWLAEPGLMPEYIRRSDRRLAAKRTVRALGVHGGSAFEREVKKRLANPQPDDLKWLLRQLGAISRESGSNTGSGGTGAIIQTGDFALPDNDLTREGLRELFDFAPGPASYRRRYTEPKRPREHDSEEQRNAACPITEFQSQCFVQPRFRNRDDLIYKCQEIAYSPVTDGIYLLAGGRGSGKSSFLNLLEWFWRNPVKSRARPLMVRFDLGVGTGGDDGEANFLKNLMAELCQTCLRQCRDTAHIMERLQNILNVFSGRLGEWCRENRRWAQLVLVVALFALLGTTFSELKGPARPPMSGDVSAENSPTNSLALGYVFEPTVYWQTNEQIITSKEQAPGTGAAQTAGQSSKATLKVEDSFAARHILLGGVALVAWLVWLLGVAYVWGRSFSDARRISKTCGQLGGSSGRRALLVLLTAAALIGSGLALGLALQRGGNLFSVTLAIAGPFLAWLMVSFFLLPPWWYAYTLAGETLRRLQASDSGSPDLGGAGVWLGFVAAMLPKGAASPDLRDMPVPFLEQDVKELLRELVRAFGSVLILVDDVDVLENEEFSRLMRMLRPLSKVKHVCAVIAVPRFFYASFHHDQLNDLHSTAREVYAMADSKLFEVHGRKITLSERWREALKEALMQFLLTKLRLRIVSPNDWKPAPAEEIPDFVLLFSALLWERFEQTFARPRRRAEIRRLLESGRITLRELVRECDRMFGDWTYQPFSDLDGAGDDVESMKTEFDEAEYGLLTELTKRQQRKTAAVSLSGHHTNGTESRLIQPIHLGELPVLFREHLSVACQKLPEARCGPLGPVKVL